MGSSSKRSSDPAIDRSDDAPAGLPQLIILLALSLLFFLPKLGMPFLDPDEGLYATIAQEMLGDSDWVIPHVNGLPYLEKPPLYFWLTALAFRVAGPSEWATRLPSALAALGTFVVIDKMTPFHLWNQIVQEKNLALAVLLGAMSIGLCIIIAAAVH